MARAYHSRAPRTTPSGKPTLIAVEAVGFSTKVTLRPESAGGEGSGTGAGAPAGSLARSARS